MLPFFHPFSSFFTLHSYYLFLFCRSDIVYIIFHYFPYLYVFLETILVFYTKTIDFYFILLYDITSKKSYLSVRVTAVLFSLNRDFSL